MSQLEYTEEFEELEVGDSGASLVTTLLVCSGVCILAATLFLLSSLGKNFLIGMDPFKPINIKGSVTGVSDDGAYVSFSLDRLTTTRSSSRYLLRASGRRPRVRGSRRHRAPPPGQTWTRPRSRTLQSIWNITINPDEFIGRVLSDYTTRNDAGELGIQKDDNISSLRPLNAKGPSKE